MVALTITILVGIGAFTIDLGALYAEKRQLQNGADAAALAVAQDCAHGDCGSYNATAKTYADLNAHDGVSAVDAVCGNAPGLPSCTDAAPSGASKATGWVRVKTSTLESDGSDQIRYVMAPVMNAATGGTVHAAAAVAWGTPASGAFVPFVFSICEFEALGGSFDGQTFPADSPKYIYFHGNNQNNPAAGSCIPSPSGQRIPGGFGRADSVNCVATFDVGVWIGSDPGNDLARNCPLASWQGQDIVIALYDQARQTGNTGQYHIVGFVGFTLLGYRLGGNRDYSTPTCPLVGNPSDSYFCGKFTKVSLNRGDFGNTSNYGASVVKMVG